MIIVFFRTLIIYSLVFFIIRIMGKKELSQIQPFEFVIVIILADLAASPMSSEGMSILNGIIAIITLFIVYIIFSFLIKNSNKIEKVFCGRASLIIVDGKIIEEEFEKQEYTIEELMCQIRGKGCFKIQDIKYGILETNGDLNIIKKDENINLLPLNIITNGNYLEENIKLLGLNIKDVEKNIKKKKISKEDILLATLEGENLLYQLKKERN